jgi:hypothetical protein
MIYQISETGFTPRLAQKALNRINRTTAFEMATEWKVDMLPDRFTHRGATELGFTPRNFFYERRKLRVWGHTYPNVWSGKSRDRCRLADVKAVATKHEARARVVIDAPTLNLNPRGSRINKREEIVRTSVREANELGETGTKSRLRQLSALNEKTTTTIG